MNVEQNILFELKAKKNKKNIQEQDKELIIKKLKKNKNQSNQNTAELKLQVALRGLVLNQEQLNKTQKNDLKQIKLQSNHSQLTEEVEQKINQLISQNERKFQENFFRCFQITLTNLKEQNVVSKQENQYKLLKQFWLSIWNNQNFKYFELNEGVQNIRHVQDLAQKLNLLKQSYSTIDINQDHIVQYRINKQYQDTLLKSLKQTQFRVNHIKVNLKGTQLIETLKNKYENFKPEYIQLTMDDQLSYSKIQLIEKERRLTNLVFKKGFDTVSHFQYKQIKFRNNFLSDSDYFQAVQDQIFCKEQFIFENLQCQKNRNYHAQKKILLLGEPQAEIQKNEIKKKIKQPQVIYIQNQIQYPTPNNQQDHRTNYISQYQGGNELKKPIKYSSENYCDQNQQTSQRIISQQQKRDPFFQIETVKNQKIYQEITTPEQEFPQQQDQLIRVNNNQNQLNILNQCLHSQINPTFESKCSYLSNPVSVQDRYYNNIDFNPLIESKIRQIPFNPQMEMMNNSLAYSMLRFQNTPDRLNFSLGSMQQPSFEQNQMAIFINQNYHNYVPLNYNCGQILLINLCISSNLFQKYEFALINDETEIYYLTQRDFMDEEKHPDFIKLSFQKLITLLNSLIPTKKKYFCFAIIQSLRQYFKKELDKMNSTINEYFFVNNIEELLYTVANIKISSPQQVQHFNIQKIMTFQQHLEMMDPQKLIQKKQNMQLYRTLISLLL